MMHYSDFCQMNSGRTTASRDFTPGKLLRRDIFSKKMSYFRRIPSFFFCCLNAALFLSTVTGLAMGQSYRLATRELVEARLKGYSDSNAAREQIIKKYFVESGCGPNQLSEQATHGQAPPNVICVLPGQTDEVILVGAHTDHVKEGSGVIDNWSGAALLPTLLASLNGQPRRHTFVFVGFTEEEKGMLGSQYYADQLTPVERSKIRAMINFDTLGVGPTAVWASHADKSLVGVLVVTSKKLDLPVSGVNVDGIGSTDSESFAQYDIPRITIHSLTQKTLPLIHTKRDALSAINMNDYYDTYKLMSVYLAVLDTVIPNASSPK
jgi:hypothetical protein